MMEDVVPKLLEKARRIFNEKIESNAKISAIYQRIKGNKSLTYVEANEFAVEAGEALASTFGEVFSADALPDGKMYYNIADRTVRPMLIGNHDIIADVAKYAQNSLNEAAGIGLKAVVPKMNKERVQGIVDKAASYETYEEAAWVLGEPVVNYSMSVVDDFIDKNCEFQYNAGFTPKITRKAEADCCEWCAGLAGEFVYKERPDDIFRRHRYCRCTVIYQPSKHTFQDVHSKRIYKNEHQAEINARNQNIMRDEKKRKKEAEEKAKIRKAYLPENKDAEWAKEIRRKQHIEDWYKKHPKSKT